MNQDPVFIIAIIGSLVWLFLMVAHEYPGLRDTYHRYLRPQVKFVVTKHNETGQFEIVDHKRILKGVAIHFEGYFDNDGGTPSTVKAMEVQLVKKYGMCRRIVGRKNNPVAFAEQGKSVITDHRGYYVGEFRASPILLATGICWYKGEFPLHKLGNNYFIRLIWHVKGQPLQDTVIHLDWESFKKDVEYAIHSLPIPDTEKSERQAT